MRNSWTSTTYLDALNESDKMINAELSRLSLHKYHPDDRMHALSSLAINEKSYFHGIEVYRSWIDLLGVMRERVTVGVLKELGS